MRHRQAGEKPYQHHQANGTQVKGMGWLMKIKSYNSTDLLGSVFATVVGEFSCSRFLLK